jgi:hypothetical protein
MSSPNADPLEGYKPDIHGDQVSFLREALSAISSYAATLYSTPSAQDRLGFVARTADAVSDLAYAWDFGGYENADIAQECLGTLEEIEAEAPELVSPITEQLREVIDRLTGASPAYESVNELEDEMHG